MLKEIPEINQFIRALKDMYNDNDKQYATKGKVYKIVGRHDSSNNPYYEDDNLENEYIDGSVLDLYELVEVPKINDFVKAKVSDSWIEDGTQFQTKGKVYKITGVYENGNPYFVGDDFDNICIDEYTIDNYEILDSDTNDKTEPVTHEFTYPTIKLIGTQVHGENFYNDDTYFSFEFKYRGDGDVLFDELSSLQADIVKLLSEKYQ